METEYNQIKTESIGIQREVESRLQRLKMGGIQWTPKLQIYIDLIELCGRC
jgi:hypothetical protein